MIGFIYKCTCSVTNKVYIGQTIQNYKYRWTDHKYNAFYEKCPIYFCKFYKAIRKYGIDSFIWEIIDTVDCEDRKELSKLLDDKEIYYISLYDSFKNGYNSTIGGDSSTIPTRKVIAYTDTGIVLQCFNNVTEASQFYNIKNGVIWSICGRFTYYTKWNNIRITFRWEDDCVTDEDIEFLNKCHYDFPIDRYDLDGNLIDSFHNVNEAASTFNLKNDRITNCCTKRTSFVQINNNRYIFRYCGDVLLDEDLTKAKNVKNDPKVSVIAIDSVTNEIIGKYISQSEASRILNVRKNNISEAVAGKRKSAGKYNGHSIKWVKTSI